MAGLSKLIGQVLDAKYQLDRLLGQGGMGAVFLATHLGTKRTVALKVIAPQFTANEEVGERFRREAEAAGRMRHPNVINVTDFGLAQVGRDRIAYLVMEYLDGCSLGDMLKEKGSLPLAFTVDIIEQICLAIGHAHKQGVIHRDLKPDNIWLQPDQRGGHIVKVLDFGLAKLRDTTAGQVEESEPQQLSGARTQAIAGNSSDTVRAVALTNAQRIETADLDAGTQLQSPTTVELEAATRIQTQTIPEEEKTAIFDPPDITAVAANQTQRAALSNDQEPEGATLIQNAVEDGEGATRIQPAQANNTARVNSTDQSAAGRRLASGALSASQSSSRSSGASGTGSTSAVELTRIGSVLGTPLYMSPEQCRGELLDARSDIYSLGVIVYQMLAGEPPFKGNMTELISKHTDEAPPPLEIKREDIPQSVAALVMSALAKNPAQRPLTADSFSGALRATAEGEMELLRQSKAYYYTSQRVFFGLSAFIYLPFAMLSVFLSLLLPKFVALTSISAVIEFYLFIFLLMLFATKICTAACTLAIKELRRSSNARVKPWLILKTIVKRSPALLGTTVLNYARVLFGLIRLIVPGARAFVDGSLFPQVVALEQKSGSEALSRSKSLVARLRPIAAALQAREFGISLGAIIFFPFITIAMALLFGGSGTDSLNALTSPLMRNFIVGYCWFILTIMHTPYNAVPLAGLYFRARQAQGETDDEELTGDRQQEETRRRPARVSKATLAWLIIPLAMLAFLIIFSFTGGRASLIETVRQGRYNEVKKMLASGTNPNVSRVGGTTALMYAARDGYADIAKLLIAAGANIRDRDGDGDDALIYAAIEGRADVIDILLQHGADVNGRNRHEETPLIVAARRGRIEAVKRLIAAGADASAKDDKGKTALAYAKEEGHDETAELLSNAGAKP